jgi:NAD(P)-dependent dehydrogenase (short-subunit alcohol dehydrogenase family)
VSAHPRSLPAFVPCRTLAVMVAPDVASLFSLRGRVAVVTGGTRGLGLSIARGFAAAGAQVVVASRSADACAEAAAVIRADGGDALGVACHLGEPAQIDALVEATVARFGRLDCVVNNAATPLRTSLTDFDMGLWRRSLDVNLTGPLLLVRAALPHLDASDSATVINVLSVGGLRGSMSLLGYGSAKAALRHATEVLAAELAPRGIRVNAIAPGPFATKMLTSGDASLPDTAAAGTLLRRVAEPDEIIGAALFLATAASSYVTGAVLLVDGGQLA